MISRSGAPSNTTITTSPPSGTNYTSHAALSWTLVPTSIRGFPSASLPRVSTMADKSKEPTKRDGAILSLDVAIGLVNIGKQASSMTPAPAVFGVATILLITIRVSFIPSANETFQAQ